MAPRTINSTSKPTDTQVTQWITEAESRVDLELAASGVATTPVTGTKIVNVLKAPVACYAAARFLVAKHTAEDDPPGGTPFNENELRLVRLEWDALIADIRANPDRWKEMAGETTGDAGTGQLRSYQTDRAPLADDKTIDNGDFDPVFTRDKKW